MGMVSANHWTKYFLVIADKFFRVYLSEHGADNNPSDTIFEFPLDKSVRSSAWKRKEYHEVTNVKQDFFCFYLEQGGILMASKLFKIGCTDIELVEKIIRCIEFNTSNKVV